MALRSSVRVGSRGVLCELVLLGLPGCAPTVNVLGVYFPGWLLSAVAGVLVAYAILVVLARRAAARELAQSGLLFCGLTVSIALAVWWVFFSRS